MKYFFLHIEKFLLILPYSACFMYFRGKAIYIIAFVIVFFFTIGFFFQHSYLQKEFHRYRKISWTLAYNAFVECKMRFKNLESTSDTSMLIQKMHLMLQNVLSHTLDTEDIFFEIFDDNEQLLHRNKQPRSLNYLFFLSSSFRELTTYEHPVLGKFHIQVLDVIAYRNKKFLFFFHALWILLCISTIGLALLVWEKNRRSQKIRLDVVNNLAHEFKTPLTSIKLLSDLIRKKNYPSEEKLKQYATIIYQESDRVLRQAHQMIQSAYYDSSELTLLLRFHNIHGIIQYFIQNYLRVFEYEKLVFQSYLQATQPYVRIDRNHFLNVLTNLLDNAKKYCTAETLIICIRTYNIKNKVYVEFSDNGVGIPPKLQKYIFDRFYRVPDGNRHNTSGYGIGLYYVKTVLEKMEASIQVRSKESEGSTFIISMKIQKSPAIWQKKK